MNNNKTNFKGKLKGPILIIVGVLIIMWLSYRTHQQNLNQINRFEKVGLYTIGKVVEYGAKTGGTNGGSSAFIKISYTINGLNYISECAGFIPSTNGPKEGDKYITIYLPMLLPIVRTINAAS